MKRIALFLIGLAVSLTSTAQEVANMITLEDGNHVITTTECRFAKSSGLFGHTYKMAMSHVTYADDGTSTFAIVMPINLKHRSSIPTGSRMTLQLQDGTQMTLPNILRIERKDNREEYDRTFTVKPEYAITEEQFNTLTQIEVTAIRLELEDGYYDIKSKDFTKEWIFSRMLGRCHNVLQWKLNELKYTQNRF